MARITVRVVPRSGRSAVEVAAEVVTVRVRAAPEGGKATDEARRTLAAALGVPASAVTLFRGRRSRTKVFDVASISEEEALARLPGSGGALC